MGSTRQSLLSLIARNRRGMARFLRVLWQALAALPLASKTLSRCPRASAEQEHPEATCYTSTNYMLRFTFC